MIKTVADFDAALEQGPYAWPGGYPLYFVLEAGEALSFDTAKEEADRIREELRDKCDPEWRPIAVEVNWEDPHLYCAHTNRRIESAYAEEEEEETGEA